MNIISFGVPKYGRTWIFLDLLGALVGVVGGLGAIIFHYMLGWINLLFFDFILPLLSWNVNGFNLGLVLLPALGGLIIGPLIMNFSIETKGHGVPEVMEAVILNKGRIRKRVAFLKATVSSITIGSGGSAGTEGPIAQIGATIGSLVGQVFRLNVMDVRLLVVCGLSAGIAGTFNAPLGGAIFGMEILFRGIGLFNAMPVILASFVGAATSSVVLGQSPAFNAPSILSWSPEELIFYVILGVFLGLISVIWVKTIYSFEDGFERLRMPAQFRPALGGLATGFLIMIFPQFGISGEGYEGVNMAFAGKMSIILLLSLGILKILATSCTLGSGGSGSVFAPSLYIGAMFGGAIGLILQQAFPTLIDEPSTYFLAGMGALFAGAAQAPLTLIVMIPEISKDYALIPPLAISSITSFIVAWIFLKGSSIYTIKLERSGVKLRMGRSFTLDSIKVEEIMTRNVVTVKADMTLSTLELLFEEKHHMGYPVAEGGRLTGIVTISDLQKVPPSERSTIKVGEAATKNPIIAYPDETVHSALDKMYEYNIGRLPVVHRDDPGSIVGIISKTDVLRAEEIAS